MKVSFKFKNLVSSLVFFSLLTSCTNFNTSSKEYIMNSNEKDILNIKSDNQIKKLVTQEGKIAYQDFGGSGEAVICIPSLGDTMKEYRFLAEKLKKEGYRVITMDLRGHGNSDTTFTSYNAMDIANDISLLIKELNLEKVNLIGCSISGGSIAVVSALNPDKVKKLVMISPFSRDVEGGDFIANAGKILLFRPWGPSVWGMYYSKLYPKRKPSDFDSYLSDLKENLSQVGRIESTVKMFSAKKSEVTKSLSKVNQDSLIIMGSKDIDFPDPQAEAELLSKSLGKQSTIKVLDGLGHYPHAEEPEITGKIIIDFLKG